MKILLVLLFAGNSFASTNLATNWVSETATQEQTTQIRSSIESIMSAQGIALDAMEAKDPNKLSGFKMNEMVTDIAVSKTGLLGLSALKSNNGVEIKWKKKSRQMSLLTEDTEPVDISIDGVATEEDIEEVSDSIFKIVESSGKVKKSRFTKLHIKEALVNINENIKNIQVTRLNGWELRGLRLDLNFSASGQLWMFTKAGVALRIRMEWKLKDLPLSDLKLVTSNEETRFVVKTLDSLNQALQNVPLSGFDAKKVSIGVGVSQKKKFFGLWKYSAGFVGYLAFIPVNHFYKSLPVILPQELRNEGFTIGGEEETNDPTTKSLSLPGTGLFSREHFVAGMEKSLKTAAFFADSALRDRSQYWSIAEIKTFNDISYTGFFGLSDFTTKGVVEIDFKRN